MTSATDGFAGMAAMTVVDWIGLTAMVTMTLFLAGAYIYAFWPGNAAKMDKHRYIPLEDGVEGDKERHG